MSTPLTLGPVHHVALRVAQLDRSVAFYQAICGFQVVATLPDVTILSNGTLILGLRDQATGGSAARFDEFRVGLDHVSFAAGGRTDLERAVATLDAHGVPHGEIKDLGPAMGMYVLAFRDPDNIQLELTGAYGGA